MAHSYTYRRRVAFAETDLAGIMHFSNFFRLMEEAEHAFFRSLGFSIHTELADGTAVGWPRVEARCNYLAPLRFEEEVEVHLRVAEIRSKSLVYRFLIDKVPAAGGGEGQGGDGAAPVRVAEGTVAAVCVSFDPERGTMGAVPIPGEVREKLEVAPG